jgi:hypothetical protein
MSEDNYEKNGKGPEPGTDDSSPTEDTGQESETAKGPQSIGEGVHKFLESETGSRLERATESEGEQPAAEEKPGVWGASIGDIISAKRGKQFHTLPFEAPKLGEQGRSEEEGEAQESGPLFPESTEGQPPQHSEDKTQPYGINIKKVDAAEGDAAETPQELYTSGRGTTPGVSIGRLLTKQEAFEAGAQTKQTLAGMPAVNPDTPEGEETTDDSEEQPAETAVEPPAKSTIAGMPVPETAAIKSPHTRPGKSTLLGVGVENGLKPKPGSEEEQAISSGPPPGSLKAPPIPLESQVDQAVDNITQKPMERSDEIVDGLLERYVKDAPIPDPDRLDNSTDDQPPAEQSKTKTMGYGEGDEYTEDDAQTRVTARPTAPDEEVTAIHTVPEPDTPEEEAERIAEAERTGFALPKGRKIPYVNGKPARDSPRPPRPKQRTPQETMRGMAAPPPVHEAAGVPDYSDITPEDEAKTEVKLAPKIPESARAAARGLGAELTRRDLEQRAEEPEAGQETPEEGIETPQRDRDYIAELDAGLREIGETAEPEPAEDSKPAEQSGAAAKRSSVYKVEDLRPLDTARPPFEGPKPAVKPLEKMAEETFTDSVVEDLDQMERDAKHDEPITELRGKPLSPSQRSPPPAEETEEYGKIPKTSFKVGKVLAAGLTALTMATIGVVAYDQFTSQTTDTSGKTPSAAVATPRAPAPAEPEIPTYDDRSAGVDEPAEEEETPSGEMTFTPEEAEEAMKEAESKTPETPVDEAPIKPAPVIAVGGETPETPVDEAPIKPAPIIPVDGTPKKAGPAPKPEPVAEPAPEPTISDDPFTAAVDFIHSMRAKYGDLSDNNDHSKSLNAKYNNEFNGQRLTNLGAYIATRLNPNVADYTGGQLTPEQYDATNEFFEAMGTSLPAVVRNGRGTKYNPVSLFSGEIDLDTVRIMQRYAQADASSADEEQAVCEASPETNDTETIPITVDTELDQSDDLYDLDITVVTENDEAALMTKDTTIAEADLPYFDGDVFDLGVQEEEVVDYTAMARELASVVDRQYKNFKFGKGDRPVINGMEIDDETGEAIYTSYATEGIPDDEAITLLAKTLSGEREFELARKATLEKLEELQSTDNADGEDWLECNLGWFNPDDEFYQAVARVDRLLRERESQESAETEIENTPEREQYSEAKDKVYTMLSESGVDLGEQMNQGITKGSNKMAALKTLERLEELDSEEAPGPNAELNAKFYNIMWEIENRNTPSEADEAVDELFGYAPVCDGMVVESESVDEWDEQQAENAVQRQYEEDKRENAVLSQYEQDKAENAFYAEHEKNWEEYQATKAGIDAQFDDLIKTMERRDMLADFIEEAKEDAFYAEIERDWQEQQAEDASYRPLEEEQSEDIELPRAA